MMREGTPEDFAALFGGTAPKQPDPVADEHAKLRRLGVDVPEPAQPEHPEATPEAPAEDVLTPAVFKQMNQRRGDPLAAAIVRGQQVAIDREKAEAPKEQEAKPEPEANRGEIAALQLMGRKQQARGARLFGDGQRTTTPGPAPISVSHGGGDPRPSPHPGRSTGDGWTEHEIEDGAGLIFGDLGK